MNPEDPARPWIDPETSRRIRVRIAPHERRGTRGVEPRRNALIFGTDQGEWIGSVPVYHTIQLAHLSEPDLAERLDQAIGRG